MGMGLMPMMYAMNPTASLSPTDAAALGMQARAMGIGANGMNGVFLNPMAASLSRQWLYPMSSNQIGRDDACQPDGMLRELARGN